MKLSPIEEYNSILYKRDDLFAPFGKINGGKVRQACALFEKNLEKYKRTGVITTTHSKSPQGLIIATVANHYGVECILGVGTNKDIESLRNNPRINQAEKQNAKIKIIAKTGYKNAINKGLREQIEKHKYSLIDFGITEDTDCIFDPISYQVQNLPKDLDNLIIPVGSGLIFSGILKGLKKYNINPKNIYGIMVGKDSTLTIKKNLIDDNYHLVKSKIDYHKEIKIDEPFQMDPIYEAKTIRWFNENKIKGKSLIWIVGNQRKMLEKQEKIFTVNGHRFVTEDYDYDLTDEQCDKIRTSLKTKPSFSLVTEQMKKIHQGGVRSNHITKYYTLDLLHDVKGIDDFWSYNEYINSNDLLRVISARIKNKKMTYKKDDIVSKFDMMLKLGAPKMRHASNYPIKSVKKMIETYQPKDNNNYYDFSAGWGSRLLGSLSSGSNYFAVDPNHLLIDELRKMGKSYQEANEIEITGPTVNLKNQGSETFVPEYENKMGLAFSSPPYYDLEDYQHGEQSIQDREYDDWLNSYWRETVKNIKKYLIEDGVFLLNIKNTRTYKMLDDMKAIAEQEGFIYQHSEELEVPKRPHLNSDFASTNEEILVFSKTKNIKLRPCDIIRIKKYTDFKEKSKEAREHYFNEQKKIKEQIRLEKEKDQVLVDPDEFKETAKDLQNIFRRKRKTLTPQERKRLKLKKNSQ